MLRIVYGTVRMRCASTSRWKESVKPIVLKKYSSDDTDDQARHHQRRQEQRLERALPRNR